MKSLSLLKSPINEKLKIIHIYGTKTLKEKLRSLAIDINSYIYIIDKTDEIIIENTNNQQLSLSFDDASDIFTIRQYAIYESNFNFKKKLIFCLSSLLCLLLFIIIGLLINYNFFKIINTYNNRDNNYTSSLNIDVSINYSPVRKVGI